MLSGMGDSTLTTELGRVLVTGGSGFVGANLVTELLDIAFFDDGPPDGDPVVLLHGWPDDAHGMLPLAQLLHAYGYRTIVPEECVADLHESPHFANLYDMLKKYADVRPVADVIAYYEGLSA